MPTEMKPGLKLRRRVHHRDGRRELWFFVDDRDPRIPIRRDGQLQIVRWGNARGHSRFLPRTGWTWLSTIEEGFWRSSGAISVDIAANFAYDRGVWVHVREGIRGILVPDERGMAVCYMVCKPSVHDYNITTRNDRMPDFLGGWG